MFDRCIVICVKQKTAYEMRISDWSSDVCSSDLKGGADDGCAKESAHIHMEGTCAVRGTVSIRGGEVIAVDGKGFRDIAVGPCNWDFIKHYRLAWQTGRASCRARVCQYV